MPIERDNHKERLERLDGLLQSRPEQVRDNRLRAGGHRNSDG